MKFQDHEFGSNVRISESPTLRRQLQLLSARSISTIHTRELAKVAGQRLVEESLDQWCPRVVETMVTRMGASLQEEIPDPQVSIVLVEVARGGIILAQHSFDHLLRLGFKRVWINHMTGERVTTKKGDSNPVTGVSLLTGKVFEESIEGAVVIMPDPMCATGSTGLAVAETILSGDLGAPKELVMVHFIATPRGINAILEKHPEVKFMIGRVDPELTRDDYVIPGAGGFGETLSHS